jgi:acetyl-CoA carboxylase biotin carboxyl carrier protein
MTDSEPASGEVFDIDRILRLVELMKEHDLSEVDLRQSDQRIRLRRGSEPVGQTYYAPAAPAMPAASVPSAPSATPAKEADGANIVLIKSPMVGTFYSKASPDAPKPYVNVGDNVDVDTIVGLIEAMKTYNPIPAEVRGKIVAVLISNEESVDFGKPLFKVDTSK